MDCFLCLERHTLEGDYWFLQWLVDYTVHGHARQAKHRAMVSNGRYLWIVLWDVLYSVAELWLPLWLSLLITGADKMTCMLRQTHLDFTALNQVLCHGLH